MSKFALSRLALSRLAMSRLAMSRLEKTQKNAFSLCSKMLTASIATQLVVLAN